MLRANRPILAFFDAIKALRLRQLAMILKAGYDPNLMINARGQNGLQFMVNYFGATDAHFRLQAPINKSAYLSIAKLLIDSGLDPNATDLLTDETVIFDAIRFNDRDMVALLVNYVDLSLRNKNGETALMCAARFGSRQVVRIILEHLRQLEMDGYSLRQRNRFGLTPLELARAENLEAAKVLTKHLIAYGHHTGAVLARSSSHHQLVGRPLMAYNHLRAGPSGLRGPAGGAGPAGHADLLDDSSATDYESDALAPAGPGLGPAGYAGRVPGVAAYARQPYYDPKAAEFSQYLLEQQDLVAAAERAGVAGGRAGRAASDDDDFGPAPAAGALVRSRSCILGPSGGAPGAKQQQQQQQQQKYGQTCAKKADKLAGWDAPATGGRL